MNENHADGVHPQAPPSPEADSAGASPGGIEGAAENLGPAPAPASQALVRMQGRRRTRKTRRGLRIAVLCSAAVAALAAGYLVSGFVSQEGKGSERATAEGSTASPPALLSIATASPTPTLRPLRPSIAEFTQPAHGFAIQFRSPPLNTKQDIPGITGTAVSMDIYQTYDQDSGQAVYAIPLPCSLPPENVSAVLQQSMEGSVVGMADFLAAAPVIDSQEVGTVQDYPAAWGTFTLTLPTGERAAGEVLAIAHGSTIIEVLTTSAGGTDALSKERFIESFRLLDGATPAAPDCAAPIASSTT